MSNFKREVDNNIASLASDPSLWDKSLSWMLDVGRHRYTYNFQWLGRPIIQYPQDIIQIQELIFQVKPDLVIETGIAHGGSIIMSASSLSILDVMEGLDPRASKRKVIGIDIDIREHNRDALAKHPLNFKYELIEGSSTDNSIFSKVRDQAVHFNTVMVFLDSNHTHEHVLAELNSYASLVSIGSYVVVFDTAIEDLPPGSFDNRPWDVGNNPKTAVYEWLRSHPEFEIDKAINNKLLVSVAPDGYLKRLA